MLLVEIILSLLFLNSIHQSKCQNLDATMLSNQLSILTNDVLGVQTMQDILNKYDYDNIEKENGGDLADTLKTSLQYKYQNAIDVTKQLVEIVKTSISTNNEMSAWPQCCEVSLDGFEDNHQFKQPTDFSKLCTRISSTASAEPHMLSEDAFNEMKTIYNQQNVLWQFYGDDVGGLHQYPTAETLDCVKYDARYRPWFIEAATPMPKDVVLVIDRSGSMSTEHNGRTLMDIAQEAAITVLKTLNPSDRVGLVSFSTEASTPDSGCHSERLAEASAFNGLGLEAEINNISPSGDTYYVNAINLAFDLLESSIPENQFRSQLILFLTDGIPTDSKDAVMETLLQRNQALLFKVTILTFGFGIGIDESTGILSDIALQNYQKYNLTPDTSVGEIHPGEYTYVSNPDNLRASMASYYNFISGAGTHNDILITVPYADAFGAGLLSSVLKPVRINGEFRGVVGTDIPLAEIFEDLTYFKQGEYSYAFMFDKKESVQGRTLTHPLLPLTQVVTNDYSIYVHITTLERAPEFKDVYNDTISNIPDREEGQRTFVADKIIARGDTFGEGVDVVSVRTTYYWRQVEGTTLVAVLALVEEDIAQLFRQEITGNPFVYHRIDIWKPSGIVACNHLGDYATDRWYQR
ncbi:VWFA and cache domain-containing protein 1-like [Antedon mediterranea]|uniref:VWFA and cache domain-containing protein 1-like n=1 Tax=Antedon mediterranea TaxID=105859 RepID=UPI003AF5A7F6